MSIEQTIHEWRKQRHALIVQRDLCLESVVEQQLVETSPLWAELLPLLLDFALQNCEGEQAVLRLKVEKKEKKVVFSLQFSSKNLQIPQEIYQYSQDLGFRLNSSHEAGTEKIRLCLFI